MVVMFLSCVLCCQTLALRVSIHCEGCKKKVKKVLHSIEGMVCMLHKKLEEQYSSSFILRTFKQSFVVVGFFFH